MNPVDFTAQFSKPVQENSELPTVQKKTGLLLHEHHKEVNAWHPLSTDWLQKIKVGFSNYWNSYCSLAYSALACLRTGTSGSASFQVAKKSW